MKRREKWPCVWLVLVLFLVLLSSVSVRAEEKNVITDATQTASGETQQKAKTDQMVDQIADELLEELELDEMERFLQEQQETDDLDISFGALVKGFLSGDEMFDASQIGRAHV